MKKLLLCFLPLLFIACASTKQTEEFVPNFEQSYDRASGVTTIQEYNLTKHYMPNIASSLSGENEWVTMKILKTDNPEINVLNLGWIYQYKNWLFADKIEFYNDDGIRLYLTDKKPTRDVISSSNVIEYMNCSLNKEQIDMLCKLAESENMYCIFIGSKYKTKEFVIKPKIKQSIIATLNKFNEL